MGYELEHPDQPRPGAAVHRPRPGRAAARHRGQPGHHREQRLRHRHRPDRARLRDKQEDGDRKIDVMLPHIEAQAAAGRSGVAAVGVSQEFQRVWSAYQRETKSAAPQYTFAKADRRVTCYYFYLWDEDFGSAFIKVCAYFPYPAKIWVNGHEWAKRQALKAGIGFTALSNGFASCEDPDALQLICDRLQPGTIEVFAQR